MPNPQGVRLPAEWEPQSGVMLTWPHERGEWGERLGDTNTVFVQIGAAIAAHEKLLSVCQSCGHAATVRQMLLESGARPDALIFCVADSNDTWARDHGPLTTLSSGAALLNDFNFNGWGGKFEAGLDAAISRGLHAQGAFADSAICSRDFVLEGGAIETDGRGSLLATRSSIISDTRNPGYSEHQIEHALHDWLGIGRFLWLDHGDISGDDTDGHIDTLARFTDPDTIVHATAPPRDRDHAGLTAMAQQLQGFRNPDGRPYRLLPLPFPGIHKDAAGRRLPASYANFLVINDAVLLPVYGVTGDSEAVTVMQRAFPGRQIASVDCRRIIEQNGSLHCLTMQFPAQVELCDTLESNAP